MMTTALSEGYILHVFDELESTSSVIKNGEFQHGSVVLAKSQKNGKGKSGSVWVSPPGNLYFSIMLDYLVNTKLNFVSHLVFLTAVSIREALAVEKIKYKWPNDLFIDGKKFGGILIETVVNKNIVIGIGINLISAPVGATMLSLYCDDFALKPIDLAKKIIACFDKNKNNWISNLDGFEEIKLQWNANAFMIDEDVIFNHGAEVIKGKLRGINSKGDILIEDSHGVRGFCFGTLCFM